MATENPYSCETDAERYRAWHQGWCAGYDDNEQDWVERTLPIVGELEESIRYDWENNDCVQWLKIALIFDAYFAFAPEHDWLQPLVEDAVQIQRDNSDWYMTPRERDAMERMAQAFGVSLDNEFKVTLTYTREFEIQAPDERVAIEMAQEQFVDLTYLRDVSDDGDWEVEDN